MKTTKLILAAVTALALAACGGDDDDEATTLAPLSEDATAAGMVLKVSDIPTGWSEVPDEQQEDSPFAKCEPKDDATGIRGRAESGDFSRGGSSTVNHAVGVFDTAESAQAALDRFIRDRLPCVVKAFNDGEADDDEATWSDATVSEVSFPKYGDASQLRRISVEGKARKGDATVDAFLDVLVVRKGSNTFSLIATDVFSPFDSLEDWAQRATAKLP